MLSAEPQWVALYTNPRMEKKAEKNLAEAGYEVYLPIRRELHTWSDRKKWVEAPLIKSYIFAKIIDKQEGLVRNVPGISNIVSFNQKIATIPENEIQMMKDFLATELDIQVRNTESLKTGTRVRITSGPLAGKMGMLVDDGDNGNFAVEITGISMAMVVYIDSDLMEPVNDETPTKTPRRRKYIIR